MSTSAAAVTTLRIVGGVTAAVLTLSGGGWVATELARTSENLRFTVDGAGVSAVTAVTDVGDVRVEESASGGDIEVEARLHGSWQTPRLDQEVTDGTLALTGSCRGGPFPNCEVDLVVRVPRGTDTTVRTSVGDVTAVGELSGLRLSTSTGDVTGRRLDVQRLQVSSSVGDISLTLAAPPRSVDVTHSVGNVRVVVPDDDTAYDVDVATNVGDRRVTVPVSSASPRTIRVTSSVGDIRVVPAGDVQPGG